MLGYYSCIIIKTTRLRISWWNTYGYPCIQVLTYKRSIKFLEKLIIMSLHDAFIWNGVVKEDEIDIQNIVNNAVYLQYFDMARIKYLLTKGVDWEKWHHDGFNLVLVHVDMEIKNSLRLNDKFYVESTYEKSGRLKIIFQQHIYKADNNKLIAKAKNTVVCVSLLNGKATMPLELSTLLFSNETKLS